MRFKLLVLSFLLFSSTGCIALSKAFGWAVDLEGKQVASIEALPLSPLCPGSTSQLAVKVTLADGGVLYTQGKGGGKLLWESFQFSSRHAWVSDEGVISLSENPRMYWLEPPMVRIEARDHPGQFADVLVPVTYRCAFVADFSGKHGSDGSSGSDAETSGRAGDSGSNGQDGQNGRNLVVRISTTTQLEERPLLQVHAQVRGESNHRFVLIDPDGGSLVITARGGNGGHGGHGGNGGPEGGRAGYAGSGGSGGAGGKLLVEVDPSAQPYLSLIQFDVQGGAPGSQGQRGSAGEGRRVRPTDGIDVLDAIVGVLHAFGPASDGRRGATGSVEMQEIPLSALW
jgi:hypothetical protein